MFENFNMNQLELIYLGLKSLIESKSGDGFHNDDMGHPVYRTGSRGEIGTGPGFPDSPDKNTLFKMLSELTKKLKSAGIEAKSYEWWYDFGDWQKFCKFAVDVYDKAKNH